MSDELTAAEKRAKYGTTDFWPPGPLVGSSTTVNEKYLESKISTLSARCEELERRLAEERDTTPADEEWIGSLENPCWECKACGVSTDLLCGGICISFDRIRGLPPTMTIGTFFVTSKPTRGDVRTAMRLLKIAQPTTNGARR